MTAAPADSGAGVASTDTAQFAAVVRALRQAGNYRLQVDPRPLRADPEIVTLNRAALQAAPLDPGNLDPLAQVDAQALRDRIQVLDRLGVERTDAFSRPRCPGAMIPPPVDRSGCPTEELRLAVLGLPRPGGAYWSQSVDERAEGRAKGHWAVRVLAYDASPQGANWIAYDYVIQQNPAMGAWEVVKAVPLFIVE